MKYLLIGAGITNITLGHFLASKGNKITIVDRKDHIGGNCFDYFDENSIDIHAYGTHIFHTEDAEFGDSFLSSLSGIRISMK